MEATATSANDAVRRIGMPLFLSKGWIKLLGIVSIISGLFTALTIVGILWAWLPIWMGVLLMQSASAVERSQLSGNEAELIASLGRLKLYFTINGVLMLIQILVGILAVVLFFVLGLTTTILESMS